LLSSGMLLLSQIQNTVSHYLADSLIEINE